MKAPIRWIDCRRRADTRRGREAGQGGDIGHAAVCDMDDFWPPAFNPAFRMERTKMLMQGDECGNHRYLQKA
jgi:hypothetical protein